MKKRFRLLCALFCCVTGLLLYGVVTSKRQAQLRVALWEAVEKGDLVAVEALLRQGADPNTNEYLMLDSQYRWSWHAMGARLRGQQPRYNQVPNAPDQWTADPSVSGNWTERQNWNTVLWLAVEKNREDIVRVLIASGAQDKSTGYLGTALMWAAEYGHNDIVQTLLQNGADVNATDEWGTTALWLARQEKHKAIIAMLEKAGAKR